MYIFSKLNPPEIAEQYHLHCNMQPTLEYWVKYVRTVDDHLLRFHKCNEIMFRLSIFHVLPVAIPNN